jgi:hypothetical protein
LAGGVAGVAYANFFSIGANNSGNSFATGTVVLSNNSSASAPVSLTNAVPTQNDTSTGCVTVTYTGSLTASVHLYLSSLTDNGLAQYLNVTVTRGTFSGSAPAYPSCTNFVADQGGQIYSGTLAAFPTSYATGVGNLTWTNGNSHVYQIQVQLQDTTAAEGKSASATFTWQAQNQ